MRLLASLLIGISLTLQAMPAFSFTYQYTDGTASTQVKWPSTSIAVALSSSLSSPPSNVKAGSDAVGAAERAFSHWSQVTGIQFTFTNSNLQQIGASNSSGAGANLVTLSADNADVFNNYALPGRTRVFRQGGNIVEADIAINPNLPFSTDGSANTYDLESTLTHEVGHFLGLEHSGIISATMQPLLGQNGNQTYNVPDTTTRSLSDDDIAGIRAVYNPDPYSGSISGIVNNGTEAVFGANVWAEDVVTGKVKGSNVTLANGSYRISSLPPGQYRLMAQHLNGPILATQIASTSGAYGGLSQNQQPQFHVAEAGVSTVTSGQNTAVNISVAPGTPEIEATMLGSGEFLSSSAIPTVPGRSVTILVGGTNLDSTHVQADGISITSPYFTVDPKSVAYNQTLGSNPIDVITFSVSLTGTAAPGSYSVRLKSASGDVAYLAGGVTVDLPSGVLPNSGNPIDDPTIFVSYQYRDFFSREPDNSGLSFWINQEQSLAGPCASISDSGAKARCVLGARAQVSRAFFLSIEFQQTGYFVIRFYAESFGRVPTLSEFFSGAQQVGNGVVVGASGYKQVLDNNKAAFANNWVNRADFKSQFDSLSNSDYVNQLFSNGGASASDETNARAQLIAGLNNNTETRATVLAKVADTETVYNAQYNKAFVLLQYFGYLRRNPQDPPDSNLAGYNFWLTKMNQFTAPGQNAQDSNVALVRVTSAQMVEAFIDSTEYRQRFGPS